MSKRNMVKLGDINEFKGETVNPLNYPSHFFELYSVPACETGKPEIILGSAIGSAKQRVQKDDVLLCKINPRINRVWKVARHTDHPLIASSEWIVVRSKKAFPQYLLWCLQSKPFRERMVLNVTGIGGSLTRAQPKTVAQYGIPLPPLEEQEKIALRLDAVSEVLRLRKAQLAGLDNLIRSQFLRIFVEDIECKNWPLYSIENMVEKRKGSMRTGPFGSALLHSEFVESGIFVLGIDNVVDNRFSWNRMRYITPEKYEKLKQYTVSPGDVLISIMATIGRSAVVPAGIPTAINTKHLACLTLDKELADPNYISYCIHSHPSVLRQITSESKGAIMDGLNLSIIKKITFPLPPLETQKKFVSFINKSEEEKLAIQKSLDETQRLFDSLMAEYFE